MKKILVLAVVAVFICAPLFSMGVVSNLKEKTKAADRAKAAEEKEMIASIDVLENYDVLLNMEMLEGIEKRMSDTEKTGEEQ